MAEVLPNPTPPSAAAPATIGTNTCDDTAPTTTTERSSNMEDTKCSRGMTPAEMRAKITGFFDTMAPSYDNYSAFTTNTCALELELNPVPIEKGSVVHDNGCGTGQMSCAIFESVGETERPAVVATDVSPVMLEYMRKKAWWKEGEGMRSAVMDCGELDGIESGSVSHSFTSLVLANLPDPEKAVSEVYRTVKDGGVAIAASWCRYGWAEMADGAVRKIRPDAPKVTKPPVPEHTLTEEWHRGLFEKAGFSKEKTRVVKREYWIKLEEVQPIKEFMYGAIMMVAAEWSEEEKGRLMEELVKVYDPEQAEEKGFNLGILCIVAEK